MDMIVYSLVQSQRAIDVVKCDSTRQNGLVTSNDKDLQVLSESYMCEHECIT